MEKNLNQSSKYLNIHNVACEYRDGDINKSDELVKYFEPFICEYVVFLKHGCYNIENYSIRNFVSLYKDIKVNFNSYNYIDVKRHIHSTVAKINYMFSDYEQEEFYNECVCTLLKMATKYKDDNPTFHTFVNRCFHFYLKRNLDGIGTNLIFYNDIENYKFEGEQHRLDENLIYDEIINNTSKINDVNNSKIRSVDCDNVYSDDHLNNFNWQYGNTCSNIFLGLSSFERSILVEYYIDNKTIIEMASNNGLARETIIRKKKIAIDKVEQEAKKRKIIRSNF